MAALNVKVASLPTITSSTSKLMASTSGWSAAKHMATRCRRFLLTFGAASLPRERLTFASTRSAWPLVTV